MFAVFTTVFGFLAPFLPEVIKFFKAKQDHKHEVEMLRLRHEMAKDEHTWRMAQVEAEADIAEMQTLRIPQQSFGVQILDKAHESKMPSWCVVPVFWLFALLDFLNGAVRPLVAYWIIGFYAAYKMAIFFMLQSVSDKSFTWFEGVTKIWTADDFGIVMLVLMFFFGQRAAKYAFSSRK